MPMKIAFSLFNAHSTFFTFLGYRMSYLEFFGTICGFLNVWLVFKNKIINWPIGMLGMVLYAILFYQIQLYSDMVEQAYFFIMSIYGWWIWCRGGAHHSQKPISYNSRPMNLIYVIIILVGTLIMGAFMQHISIFFPTLFPMPAAFPYLDAFIAVMNFVAMFLMAQRKIESWYLWITLDVFAINLYYIKDVKFIAIEYFIFLLISIMGVINWKRECLIQANYDLATLSVRLKI